MPAVHEMLKTRSQTHGPYAEFAKVEEALQHIVLRDPQAYSIVQRSVLRMVCHKLARIVTGDPTHIDHWADIAGYVQRAIEALEEPKKTNKLDC